MQLSDLASKNPDKVRELNVEAMIRSGLAKFTNEVGKLWTALADYYIRLGNFDRARDIFEEAIDTVITIRDFKYVNQRMLLILLAKFGKPTWSSSINLYQPKYLKWLSWKNKAKK